MFIPILVSAILAVCPVIAITLPNGFTFAETQYLNIESRAATSGTCDKPYSGCSDDCSTIFQCDGNYTIVAASSHTCGSYSPYCATTGSMPMCSQNFPMSNAACLNRALVNFVCTADGPFPDPTDCTKYHICSGANQNIVECPASHMYSSEWRGYLDSLTNPGTGNYSCRFKSGVEACICNNFSCEGKANQFTFRMGDFHHYAYCLQYGSVFKTLMFKCPNGTSHDGSVSATTNSVECLPPGLPAA